MKECLSQKAQPDNSLCNRNESCSKFEIVGQGFLHKCILKDFCDLQAKYDNNDVKYTCPKVVISAPVASNVCKNPDDKTDRRRVQNCSSMRDCFIGGKL
jgi:hypothetical protein